MEAIDPIRDISNHSSGKMGFSLTQAAQRHGANVTLISGPVNLPTPNGVSLIAVKSADEMLEACQQVMINQADVFISAAAVADF